MSIAGIARFNAAEARSRKLVRVSSRGTSRVGLGAGLAFEIIEVYGIPDHPATRFCAPEVGNSHATLTLASASGEGRDRGNAGCSVLKEAISPELGRVAPPLLRHPPGICRHAAGGRFQSHQASVGRVSESITRRVGHETNGGLRCASPALRFGLERLGAHGQRMVDDMSAEDMPGNMTDGFHLVVEALKLNGVDTIYGVAGIPITDLLRLAQAEGIRYLGFRHEQSAGNAAAIAGYLTQKPGICMTVSAPGFLNGMVALANATTNCFPMIMISGSSD